jgi:WD40 repeat protein
MQLLPGHKGRVCTLAYSPDGRTLASGGGDKRIRFWDRTTGENTEILRAHRACIYSVEFSTDGNRMASGGGQSNLWLWNVREKSAKALPGHNILVSSVAFSPDGGVLASAAGDVFNSNFPGELSLWDPNTFVRLQTAPSANGSWCLAFSPDGSILAEGSGRDGVVRLWDRGLELTATLPLGDCVRRVAFSPDGRIIATASGWTVSLWDISSRQLLLELKGHRGFVWSAAFALDGRTTLSGAEDKTVRLWDVDSGVERAFFDWKIGKVRAVAIATDGLTASAGGDEKIVIWDLDEH